MKHLNNKMIADYVLKTGSKEELDRLKTHIESCEICRKKSREIARIFQSSDNNSITPSTELQNQILAMQRKSTAIHGSSRVAGGKRQYHPGILAAAASIMIIIGISLYLTDSRLFDQQPIPKQPASINMKVIHGIAMINGRAFENSGILNEGDALQLNENTAITASYGSYYRLKSSGRASLTVNISRIENNKSTYSIAVQKGILLSDIDHRKREINYMISTPHGEIESLGTKFLVVVSEKQTDIILAEGSVRMHCFRNGQYLNGEPGKCYEIAESVTARNAEDQIIRSINNFELPDNYPKTLQAGTVKKAVQATTRTPQKNKPGYENTTSGNTEKSRYGAEKESMKEETRQSRSQMRNELRMKSQENREIRETRKGRRDR